VFEKALKLIYLSGLQETKELVAIKKFKDSEGKRLLQPNACFFIHVIYWLETTTLYGYHNDTKYNLHYLSQTPRASYLVTFYTMIEVFYLKYVNTVFNKPKINLMDRCY